MLANTVVANSSPMSKLALKKEKKKAFIILPHIELTTKAMLPILIVCNDKSCNKVHKQLGLA